METHTPIALAPSSSLGESTQKDSLVSTRSKASQNRDAYSKTLQNGIKKLAEECDGFFALVADDSSGEFQVIISHHLRTNEKELVEKARERSAQYLSVCNKVDSLSAYHN
jgi:hypothetical protein